MFVSVYSAIYKCNLLRLFLFFVCTWFQGSLLHIGKSKKMPILGTVSVYFSQESLIAFSSLSRGDSSLHTYMPTAIAITVGWFIISRKDFFISNFPIFWLLKSFSPYFIIFPK